jgi:hypothetical protein
VTPEYFEQISNAFLNSAGRGLVLSPRDQSIVARWARDGVPAKVVINGIEKALSGDGGGRTRSMSYVVPVVEESIVSWRERQVGATLVSVDEGSDWERAFASLVEALAESAVVHETGVIKAVIEDALSQVEAVRERWRSDDEFDVMASLSAIEDQTCNQLFEVIEIDHRIQIEREVEMAVSQQQFSTGAIRDESRRAFFRRRLRRLVGLPAFELDFAGGW